MTLAQLEYAVALDDHRHFSRAAGACGVTQPTLSAQIRKLERGLGIELFDRSRTPVEPTDLGREVLDRARAVLREVARLREVVDGTDGLVAGELRVGILPTLAPYVLPRFVSRLAVEHPGLSLAVEELRTEEIIEGIVRDRLDAGLVATPVETRGLVERPIFEEPFVGYVAADHRLRDRKRLRTEDLSLNDLWILNEGHCFRDQVVELCEDLGSGGSRDRPLHFESGNLETLKRLVDESGGMTLLPSLAVAGLADEERRRIRPFVDPAPSRTIRLIHGKTYLKRARIEAFTGELLDSVPGSLRTSVD